MVKVSIIVPIYNVEKYLDRCMDSLLNQTLHDIEIIMVDDGSPDNCPMKCDEYAKKDARVKVIHKQNAGLGYARNSGMEVATGEYVAFVDSDDFVDFEMYEKLCSFASSEKLDVAFCGFNYYKGNTIIDKRIEVEQNTVFSCQDVCNKVLLGMLRGLQKQNITDYEMSVWHAIYRRDIIYQNKLNFVSERQYISEDIIFHLDYLPHSQKIGFLPEPLYFYCIHSISLTNVFKEDRFAKECVLYGKIIEMVNEKKLGWSLKDISNYFALKVRYVCSSCVEHSNQIGYKKVMENLKVYSKDCHIRRWIYPYMWHFPLRYIIFYLLLRGKMLSILVKLLKK